LLSLAAGQVADPQIRHRGTLGGALAHADPAGDLGGPVLALGASFVIVGPNGSRQVDADGFFVGLFETAIGDGELLTEIRIPKHPGWGAAYEKFVRTAQQWPIVAVGAMVRMDGHRLADVRISLANMDATPLRARGVEAALLGAETDADVAIAASRAAEGANPPSDSNGDAEYRSHLARVLTKRAVITAAS
jgi:aerobic carbon-monoxide dehydrogenase medium subunit